MDILNEIVKATKGEIENVVVLPDGSGFAGVTMPLPENHWLLKNPDDYNIPPMPFRMGVNHPCRKGFQKALMDAGKYAVRCATMNGKIIDFDPDALLQCLIVGFLGYSTETGLSKDISDNPKEYEEDKN